jgi:hypothetical protein
MKILHLGHNKEKYLSGYYYQDYIRLLQLNHDVFCYGQGYPGYDPGDRIEDVYQKTGGRPNLIVVGASWERDDHPTEFDPHPAIQLDQVDVPKVMFLNKEYKKLDQKYAYIEKNGISLVLTVLRSVALSASIEGVRFLHFPFPVNIDLFKDYETPQPADFGFSGAMDRNPLRQQIRDYLSRPYFQGLKLYWAEWGSNQITAGEQYARVINLCKVYMSTPSCHGIVSPRHFEVMACRRPLLCSESDEYQGVFEPGVHCVTFSNDLSDFREKLFWLLEDHEARERIATKGYEHARANHSIGARARTFENALAEVFSLTV